MTGPRLRSVHVVVVGAGVAAVRLAERLAGHSRYAVTILGDEPCLPYNRALLPSALGPSRPAARLRFHAASWYRRNGINLRTGTAVIAIDRKSHRVVLADGNDVRYDVLVLALGAASTVPMVSGIRRLLARRCRVFTVRTAEDVRRLTAALHHARTVAVLGGGATGIALATGVALRGREVELVHSDAYLLDGVVDRTAANLIHTNLEKLGVRVRCGAPARSVVEGSAGVRLVCADGGLVVADMVVVACGARPRVRLAARAGLSIAEDGIAVTSELSVVDDPDIFAIGDCAAALGKGEALAAWEHADLLASALLGAPFERSPFLRTIRIHTGALDLAVLGQPLAGTPVTLHDAARSTYKRLAVENNRLVGALLVGDTSEAGRLALALRRPWTPLFLRGVLFRYQDVEHRGLLPTETDLLCVCRSVSVAGFRAALNETSDWEEACRRTGAGTGCGTCRTAIERFASRYKTEHVA